MKMLDQTALDALTAQARQSPRLRANHNFHQELTEPVQRLAIAMEPDTLVLPHRHPHTWEVLFALRGRFVVLIFDDGGQVLTRCVLGEACPLLEIPAGSWHSVLSLDAGGVIFEVKQGAYQPVAAQDVADWSAGQTAAQLNGWYAVAQAGARYARN